MTMPAGTYYVGDLCYVLDDEDWDEVCNITIDPNNGESIEGEFNLSNGVRFAIFGTADGDGMYLDEQNREYSVNSGTIGCVMVEDMSKDPNKIRFIEEGQIVEFKEPFRCGEKHGLLTFGSVNIDTVNDYENMEYDQEVFDDWDRD